MMSDEQTGGPTDPKPQGANNIEYVLATRANDAISKGADPHAVTTMLGQMVTHLRANPNHAASASNALAQGADPAAVASTVYELSNSATGHDGSPVNSTPETPAAGPGLLSRAGAKIASAKQIVTHPLDTAAGMAAAPVKSLFTATVAPGVGEARPDARLSKGGNSSGRAIDTTPYDAEHGGVTTGERTAAGAQSVVNAALPEAGKFVSKFAGPVLSKVPVLGKWLSKAAPLAATGAAEGAAYNPDDPAAGAISGAVVTPVVGAGIKAGASAVNLGKMVQRVRSAPDLGEAAIQHEQHIKDTNAVNYGASTEQGKATPTTPVLQQALNHEMIKPVVEAFRSSSSGKGATDAEAAAAADKLLTTERRGIKKRMQSKEGNYNYADAIKIEDILAAQKVLRSAIASPSEIPAVAPKTFPGHESVDGPVAEKPVATYTDPPNPTLSQGLRNFSANRPNAVQGPGGPQFRLRASTEDMITRPGRPAQPVPASMPSYSDAVGDMARMKGERAAFNNAIDQTRRVLEHTLVKGDKQTQMGGAAFMDQIRKLPPNEADAATTGTLGRAKEMTTPTPITPHSTLFGTVMDRTVRPLMQTNKIRPYVQALDRQSGKVTPHSLDLELAMRNLGLINAGIAPKDSTP